MRASDGGRNSVKVAALDVVNMASLSCSGAHDVAAV
jgi:hypothetical protein